MPQHNQQRIAVVSGKGGVGKSTLCVALAHELAAAGLHVLLVDCDIGLGTLDTWLGQSQHAGFSWADVALGRTTLQKALLRPHPHLHLLCAPARPEPELQRDMLCELLAFSSDYDCILLDAAAGLGLGFAAAVLASTRSLLVCTPDATSATAAYRTAEQILRLGYPPSALRLVINRFCPKTCLAGLCPNIDDLIDLTETQLLGVLPFVPSLLAGWPTVLPKPVAAATARIAQRLLGQSCPLILP